jgi:hypothetical protein
VTVARKRRPLADLKQLARRVRALASRRPSDEVEVTLTVPREVWEALEAQGPKAVERLADAVSKTAKLPKGA